MKTEKQLLKEREILLIQLAERLNDVEEGKIKIKK